MNNSAKSKKRSPATVRRDTARKDALRLTKGHETMEALDKLLELRFSGLYSYEIDLMQHMEESNREKLIADFVSMTQLRQMSTMHPFATGTTAKPFDVHCDTGDLPSMRMRPSIPPIQENNKQHHIDINPITLDGDDLTIPHASTTKILDSGVISEAPYYIVSFEDDLLSSVKPITNFRLNTYNSYFTKENGVQHSYTSTKISGSTPETIEYAAISSYHGAIQPGASIQFGSSLILFSEGDKPPRKFYKYYNCTRLKCSCFIETPLHCRRLLEEIFKCPKILDQPLLSILEPCNGIDFTNISTEKEFYRLVLNNNRIQLFCCCKYICRLRSCNIMEFYLLNRMSTSFTTMKWNRYSAMFDCDFGSLFNGS